jgi:hypothetical protein
MRHGRKKPYTEVGIKRLPCARCGEPATQQWRACADGLWRPICTKCDVVLNVIVLTFMGDPDVVDKTKRYCETHPNPKLSEYYRKLGQQMLLPR